MMSSRYLTLAALVVSPLAALAQCPGTWLQSPMTSTGVDRRVLGTALWDPDGPGPLSVTPVIVGDFENTGTQPLSRVGMWNGSAWVNLGAGFDTFAQCVHVTASNQLIVGGWFSFSGTTPVSRIARFDGTNWQPLGTGTNSVVFAITSTPNGAIYAGGWFTQAGNAFNSRVAMFMNNQWFVPGGQPSNDWVWDLTARPNGVVIAGGAFRFMGSANTFRLAQFNGVSWSQVGGSLTNGLEVYETFLMPNGDLIISGNFTEVNGVAAQNVARFDGTQWHAMGSGFLAPARDFAVVNGDLYAVNARLSPTTVAGNLVKWTGTTWTELAVSNGTVFELLALPSGELLVAGDFTQFADQPYTRIALYRPGCACDSIDFNNDGVFPENQDVIDFFNVLAGATCATCNDIDFNNNTVFPEDQDVIDFFNVLAGGTC
ncbi:MAG TPA: hypothetical protein VK157_03000 [Phycisphaerales bacterium]|nr:hypothetical protein [Phycisphaerales bacterium]